MKGRKFIPLLVIVAGLLAYHNSFTGPFIRDDEGSIQENPTIRHLWPIWQPLSPPHQDWLTVAGRPLINLSLAINYALGGYNVWGYHALNLTVHILAGLTLLGIVRRTLLQPRLRGRFGAAANELALATAVLWTVHPLQTESVTYIIQRAESIMGLFYLLTLYCFIRGTESRLPRIWYGLCLTACALGMASKEVMASAPLMMFLYDRTFVSGSFRNAWRQRWPLYLGLAATWLLVGYLLIFEGSLNHAFANVRRDGANRWADLLSQPEVFLYYLRLAVWPHPLRFDYYGMFSLHHEVNTGAVRLLTKSWMSILPFALVMAILLGATAWALKTNSVWGFLSAWFFLILATSSNVIPTPDVAFEHRMYLSLAAVIVLAVLGIHALVGRRSMAVVAVLAIALGFLTWRRNQDYRSEIAIWQDTVIKCPNDHRAHNALGIALVRLGKLPEAIEHLEQAVRIKPDDPDVHNNLGLALMELGRPQEAMEHYEQALHLNPDLASAHNNLGIVLMNLGRVPEAIEQYERTLRLKPDFAGAHINLGVALWEAGRRQEAIEHWREALRIKPRSPRALNNLGVALSQTGRIEEAIRCYEQALQIDPDYPEAHYNLGNALEQTGQPEGAIEHYEQTLRLRPDSSEVRNRLARLRAVQ